MTTKYRAAGDTINFDPAATYTKGVLYMLGGIPGVALDDYVSADDDAVFGVSGVWELPLNASDTATRGNPAYWDETALELVDDPAGGVNPQVGFFWNTSTGTTAEVLLLPGSGYAGAEIGILSIDDTDSPYSLADDDRDVLILVDSSSAAVTVNLPAAAGMRGRRVTVKQTAAAGNTVTIDGNASETIDGALTNTDLGTRYDSLTLVCDGSNWHVEKRESAAVIAIDDTDSPYTLAAIARDTFIDVDSSSAAVTINLPAAAGVKGRRVTVKLTGAAAAAVTIDGNASETIDGALTLVLDGQYSGVELLCDGSNWHVMQRMTADVVSHEFTADGATLTLTAQPRDMYVIVDTQAGAVEADLPTAASMVGRKITFVRAGTGVNAITIDQAGAETINGSGTANTDLDAQHDTLTIMSDGTGWIIIASIIA